MHPRLGNFSLESRWKKIEGKKKKQMSIIYEK
jgi:hypothetical protein